MPLDLGLSRRHILQILAGGAALAAGSRPSLAGEARIGRLIGEAKALPAIAQRIDFIASVYCGPVLRHPAELIQAANDRSVVTV